MQALGQGADMSTFTYARHFLTIAALASVFAAVPVSLTARNATGWKLEIVAATAQEPANDAAETRPLRSKAADCVPIRAREGSFTSPAAAKTSQA